MKRLLPRRPSLVQLKHQAKDLRAEARERDRDALATLRNLRRFAGAPDEAITAADISLGEAQLALAIDHGFASWSELKAHVEAVREAAGLVVARPDQAASIAGFEHAQWGGGTRRSCSTIAALALVSERADDATDYDHLMGASGLAFRVQMFEERMCPSSPHAACGFDCTESAMRAWGSRMMFFVTREEGSERTRACDAVKESVEKGVPALYDREETSLIVGYTNEHMLLRGHSARDAGYTPMGAWPWRIGVASTKTERLAPRMELEQSLAMALHMFDLFRAGRYASGRQAYARWCAMLRDDESFARASDVERSSAALGNAHTFESLGDARGAAANYLSSMCAHAPVEAQVHLHAAAAHYGQIETTVRAHRREVVPYPWELAHPAAWTAEMRRREAHLLENLASRDEIAIGALRRAQHACAAHA